MLHPGLYLRNKDNHQTAKISLFKQKEILFFTTGILNKKTAFSLYFEIGNYK